MNGVAPDDGVQLKVLNYFVTIGATQHVNEPTRNDIMLDLLFSNDPMIVSDLAVDVTFSASAHNSLYFTLIVNNDDSTIRSCLTSLTICMIWTMLTIFPLVIICRILID